MSRSGTGGRRLAAVAAMAAVVLAAGCSTKAQAPSGGTASGGGVKTGPGVTADTITLGALTDLTGVFSVVGKAVTQGNQLYVEKVNAAGGVCGRKLKLDVKDHGYNVQKAVGAYADMQPNVLGFVQLLGSPMNAALLQNYTQDKVLVAPASWASTLLANPNIAVMGTTYDLEMINSVQYLVDQGKLAKGDSVGDIYIEGEYGQNGLIGTQYAAQQLGLKVVPAKIKATDQDMSAQVTQLKSAGVKAILLTTTPTQTASVAAVAKSLGFNVPIVGNNPTYVPGLLKTPAAPALKENFLVAASSAPFDSKDPAAQAVAKAFSAKYPNEIPNGGVDYGYGVAEVFTQILKKACDSKDLSRQGVLNAFRQTTSADTGGLIATLDFSKPGSPASRQVYIAKPADVPGGLSVVKPLFESPLAQSYKAPAQK